MIEQVRHRWGSPRRASAQQASGRPATLEFLDQDFPACAGSRGPVVEEQRRKVRICRSRYELEVEALDRLVRMARVATLRASHRDIDAAVCVTVDPDRDLVAAHQGGEVTDEGAGERPPSGSISRSRGGSGPCCVTTTVGP